MKISILGAGRVGSSIAFLLLSEVKPKEVVLYDINSNLVRGEALDLGHASVSLSPETKVIGTTDISKITDSDFVIITAGKARTTEQSRAELADFNGKIIADLSKNIEELSPKAVVLVVTNPSTQMAETARNNCSNKVIAMDNQLDTSRLKFFISEETSKQVSEINSSISGEHGENMQFEIKENLSEEQIESVKKRTLGSGKEVIQLKGYTCWGIASCVVRELQKYF